MPPPPDLGSGKFGTPCARMHSATLIPADDRLEFGEPLEEPQAASATAHPAVMSARIPLLTRMATF